MAKLGRSLDVALYEKVGRELCLTRHGEALAAFAADQERSADDFLAGLGSPTPSLRLAGGRAAIQWVLDRPLGTMVRRGVDLQVTPADRPTALHLVETGQADVAAIAYDPPPDHLCSAPLTQVPQVLVAPRSHPLIRSGPSGPSGPVRLGHLDGLGLVVPPRQRPHRRSLERALDGAGVGWRVAGEADGWDLVLHLVKLGVGVAVVNGCVPIPRPLGAVEIDDLPPVGYWLVWREQRQGLIDGLLTEVGQHG